MTFLNCDSYTMCVCVSTQIEETTAALESSQKQHEEDKHTAEVEARKQERAIKQLTIELGNTKSTLQLEKQHHARAVDATRERITKLSEDKRSLLEEAQSTYNPALPNTGFTM